MFKISSVLAVLSCVLFGLLSSGCPDAQGIANDLTVNIDQEQANFNAIQGMRGIHGDAVADALNDYSRSISEVSGRVAQISDRLSRKPEEKGQVADKLVDLQKRLEVVLAQSVSLNLEVPVWRFDDANDSVKRALVSQQSLARAYKSLYSIEAGQLGQIAIGVQPDESLYDTCNDCVQQFALYGLAHNDPDCANEARSHCGHQMDLDCVSRVLILNSTFGCTHTVNNVPLRANWLIQVDSCASRAPVYRR